jgi:uncharacterized membrane protein
MDLLPGLREIPNVHVIVVHFPIALLPVALGFDLLGRLTGSRELHAVGRWTLWAGTLAAALAVWSGLAGENDVHPYVTEAAEEIIEQHERLQLGTLGAAIGLSLWRAFARAPFPERGGVVYFLLAAAMVANLVVASDLGGQMVFEHGVAVRADADSLQGGDVKPGHPQ